MIPGDILETAGFDRLSEGQRDDMAAALGRLYAALHAIPVGEATAVGAVAIPEWDLTEETAALAKRMLPAHLHGWVHAVLDAYAGLPPDDEAVTGYFDGHGWNMAFDHQRGVLNGVYDFADGGIGAPPPGILLRHPDCARARRTHHPSLRGADWSAH